MVLSDSPRSPQTGSDPAQWSVLMAAAQDGDRDAYRLLLMAITPYIRAIASRALRDPPDVEDVLQDVLIAIHEARPIYDRARPFKPWLIGIARHRITDRLRARGRKAARETQIENVDVTFTALAANQDDMKIDVHALHLAMARLPPGQRVAIEELKLRELSLLEVSERTGMSVAALKVAVHRGIKQLRKLLIGKDKA